MQSTIYDGRTWKPCTVQDAQAAMKDTNLSWIDVRLDSENDTSADAVLAALGVDATAARTDLASNQGTDFTLSATEISGSAWLAGDTDSTPEHARFLSDPRRLVTIRLGGDKAFAQVQAQLALRAGLALHEPSRLLGFVLQAMQTTLQQSLTALTIQVGVLDMEIITTSDPSPPQTQALVEYRQQLQPFVTRFPSYLITVTSALLDPDTITVTDQAGVKELQSFAAIASSTEGMINTLVGATRNAVQDLQGQIANWQGQRINQLTVVTIIFLPITFLTGYFGMNFQWIDNLITGEVAYYVLGVALPIALLAGSTIWLVRRGYRVSLKPRDRKKRPSPSS